MKFNEKSHNHQHSVQPESLYKLSISISRQQMCVECCAPWAGHCGLGTVDINMKRTKIEGIQVT